MPTITDRLNNVHARGKNLAVIVRHARKHPVEVIRAGHAVNEGYSGNHAVTFYFEHRSPIGAIGACCSIGCLPGAHGPRRTASASLTLVHSS